MTSPLKIGIVGCGNIADNHVRAYQSIDNVEVTAVCDVDIDRAQGFATARGITSAVGSVSELLDLGLDAVSVCTPHPTHEIVVTEVASRGVHVLCEKPIAVDSAAAERMMSAAETAGATLGVVFQRRFWSAAQRIRSAIDSGSLGTPMLGNCQVLLNRGDDYYNSAPWRGTWAADGGGVLMTQAVHYVDLLQWYLGEPVEVYAATANFTHGSSIEVEDTTTAVITFASGAMATVGATVSATPSIGTSLTVTGTSGATVSLAEYPEGSDATIEIWGVPSELETASALASKGFQPNKSVNEVNADLEMFHLLQVQDFVSALRENREPTVTGKDALNSLYIIEAVYESARTGHPVQLPGTDKDRRTIKEEA